MTDQADGVREVVPFQVFGDIAGAVGVEKDMRPLPTAVTTAPGSVTHTFSAEPGEPGVEAEPGEDERPDGTPPGAAPDQGEPEAAPEAPQDPPGAPAVEDVRPDLHSAQRAAAAEQGLRRGTPFTFDAPGMADDDLPFTVDTDIQAEEEHKGEDVQHSDP